MIIFKVKYVSTLKKKCLDISDVTTMNNLLSCYTNYCGDIRFSSFNTDISCWSISKVISMEGMFRGTSVFNNDISSCDVSKVTSMAGMFYEASVFNTDILILVRSECD